MSDKPSPELKFEIGHVLLIDIVGYSKLLINEQRELLQELNEIVRQTAQVRAADATGLLLRLPTGDGVALVFRDSAESPVRCALEVGAALKSHLQLKVRMGIHSGPVSEVQDVTERTNVAGAGINMAQRVMDCGDAGHILLSKRVADDLAQYRHWNAFLHDLGECEVKHAIRMGIVNLYTDKAGNAEVPAKLQNCAPNQTAAAPTAGARLLRAWVIALLGAGAIAAAVGLWLYSSRPHAQPRLTARQRRRSRLHRWSKKASPCCRSRT